MKKALLFSVCLLLGAGVFAEEKEEKPSPSLVIAPNLIGPLFGLYSGVINFKAKEDVSLDTEFFYWNVRTIPLIGDAIEEGYEFWTGGLKVGPSFYFNRAFHGLFIGGYGKFYYFYIGTEADNFNAGAIGAGAKLGWSGTWDWFNLTIAGGYEYNKAFADITLENNDVNLGQVEGGAPFFILQMGFAVY